MQITDAQTSAKLQRERDMAQICRIRSFCIDCGKLQPWTIDGRCMPCYDLREIAIFGVSGK